MSYDATLRFRRMFRKIPGAVDGIGEQALFYGESVRYIPNALTRYRRETIRLVAEMTLGAGALVMIGGTVGVAVAVGPRIERYQQVLAQMLEQGLAYRCYMSSAELDALRERQTAAKQKPRYDGTWRPEPGSRYGSG